MRLKLPARYEDMTLGMLQTIETTDDMLACLEVCTGQPKEQLRQLPKILLQEGYKHIQDLRKEESPKHFERFTLKGTEYGFIPNWDEFTAGEWIDAEQYAEDFWPNAHKLMALLFRPVERSYGDKYSIKAYTAQEDAEPFLEMPAQQVAGALLFFSRTKNVLLNNLRRSLIATAMGRTISETNGDGTLSSINSQGNRFLKWMRSRLHRWGLYSHTWRF